MFSIKSFISQLLTLQPPLWTMNIPAPDNLASLTIYPAYVSIMSDEKPPSKVGQLLKRLSLTKLHYLAPSFPLTRSQDCPQLMDRFQNITKDCPDPDCPAQDCPLTVQSDCQSLTVVWLIRDQAGQSSGKSLYSYIYILHILIITQEYYYIYKEGEDCCWQKRGC